MKPPDDLKITKEEVRHMPVVFPKEIWDAIDKADSHMDFKVTFQKRVQGYALCFIDAVYHDRKDPVELYEDENKTYINSLPDPHNLHDFSLEED
jgi:hypothetical protein